MHRDLKGANLLVNNRGELKITDFGLARPIEENRIKYTPGVVTRWYRPPELLFGSEIYTESIDIWGAGCIIAEMYLRKPLFGAESDLDQLKLIFRYCGTPTEESYPDANQLPDYSKVQFRDEKRILKEYLDRKGVDREATDLIDKMLVINPKKRITAIEALTHEYFKCDPLPCQPSEIGKFESSHVYTVQKQKEREREQNEEIDRTEYKRSRNEHYPTNSQRDFDGRRRQYTYSQMKYSTDQLPPPPPPPPESTVRDRHTAGDTERTGSHHRSENIHRYPHRPYDNQRPHHNNSDAYIRNSGHYDGRKVFSTSNSNLNSTEGTPEKRHRNHHESSGSIEGNRRTISYEDL